MSDKKKLQKNVTDSGLAKNSAVTVSLAGRALKAIAKIDDSHYQNGLNLFSDKSYEEAFRCFKQGANINHPPSQNALGCMFEKGLGTEQSSEQAFYWFAKAADQGYAAAEYSLGFMYAYGRSVELSTEKAYCLTKSAAEKGYREAQYFMAFAIMNGPYDGTEKEEFFWAHKAAQQGDQWAQWGIFYSYQDGKVVDKSIDLALYWLNESAKERPFKPEEDLAFLYKSPDYFDRWDMVDHFGKKYTGKGCLYAQEQLGDIYAEGEIVNPSYDKAVFWYKKSLDQGNKIAEDKLTELYLNGVPVVKTPSPWIDILSKTQNGQ